MHVTSASKRMSPRTAPAPVVLIRSSAYSSLPSPGNRVGPADASNMPCIVAPGTSSAITAADGAHHYRFFGIEIKSGSGNNVTSLVTLGNAASSLANFPTDITFDRCYIHNASGGSGRRGLWFDVIRGAIVDSYISGFRSEEHTSELQSQR